MYSIDLTHAYISVKNNKFIYFVHVVEKFRETWLNQVSGEYEGKYVKPGDPDCIQEQLIAEMWGFTD